MNITALYVLLVYAATAIGVPVPPMPTVYPSAPEAQICALKTGRPCNPDARLRSDKTVWLGVADRYGKWIAISSDLSIGSTYWKGVVVHEFTHTAQAHSGVRPNRACQEVTEYQAQLVMEAWFKSQGTSMMEVTGWNLPPFEASKLVILVCGKPHLALTHEEEKERGKDETPRTP